MYIDTHIHVSLNGKNSAVWRKQLSLTPYESILSVLKEYRSKNILLLRDGGDPLGISLKAREIAQEVGIIYKTPGWAIYKKGHYGNFIGKPVTDIEDFKREFKELLKVKPDHLKIILTGIVDFDRYGKVGATGFSFEEMKVMVECAKEKGLSVMVHANTSKAVALAIKAGVDTVEHGYFIGEEELHSMAENDVIWVPTLAPLGNLVDTDDPKFHSQRENIKRIYEEHIANIKKAIKIGVKIAIGSDAGSYGVYHCEGFFNEVRHMTKAGMSKDDVYKMAFENGIKALGIKAEELIRITAEFRP